MNTISVFGYYLQWHYTKAYVDISHIWVNFIAFFYNFFSVGFLFRHLLEPFKRMGEERKSRAWDLGDMFEVFVVNIIMRFIGATLRTALISIGLILMLITTVLGIIFFIAWTFMPILIMLLVLAGLKLTLLSGAL